MVSSHWKIYESWQSSQVRWKTNNCLNNLKTSIPTNKNLQQVQEYHLIVSIDCTDVGFTSSWHLFKQFSGASVHPLPRCIFQWLQRSAPGAAGWISSSGGSVGSWLPWSLDPLWVGCWIGKTSRTTIWRNIQYQNSKARDVNTLERMVKTGEKKR